LWPYPLIQTSHLH